MSKNGTSNIQRQAAKGAGLKGEGGGVRMRDEFGSWERGAGSGEFADEGTEGPGAEKDEG